MFESYARLQRNLYPVLGKSETTTIEALGILTKDVPSFTIELVHGMWERDGGRDGNLHGLNRRHKSFIVGMKHAQAHA
ncbi:unnamed protein product [Danaus chrysippus]|uniref:(African queen) hypothetical protein n=1 Tax=Danaus chrysippus TaxID=151541 RepID=A0A8J2VTQ8_9NEOP|nr:unnamed protein product [Danaus chrysippus]